MSMTAVHDTIRALARELGVDTSSGDDDAAVLSHVLVNVRALKARVARDVETERDSALAQVNAAAQANAGLRSDARRAVGAGQIERLRAGAKAKALARAVEALRPFAELGDEYGKSVKYAEADDDKAVFTYDDVPLTIGALRQAQAVVREHGS